VAVAVGARTPGPAGRLRGDGGGLPGTAARHSRGRAGPGFPAPRERAGAVRRGPSPLPLSFTAALDDDLCVPAALAAVHATVRDGNYALSTGDRETAGACLAQARAMLAVLGLGPLAPVWPEGEPGGGPDRLPEMVEALVVLALGQREAARGRGDYTAADSIRDTLESTGVLVEDTPDGPRWELAR
jgi:cysteinyl-tRNA synthetase